jgi:hypothetical protein
MNKTACVIITSIAVLGLLLPSLPISNADQERTFNVIVKDSDGNPIESAFCEIIGADVLINPTDNAGHATGTPVDKVKPGTYVLKCSSPNFNGSTYVTIGASGDVFLEITVGMTKS